MAWFCCQQGIVRCRDQSAVVTVPVHMQVKNGQDATAQAQAAAQAIGTATATALAATSASTNVQGRHHILFRNLPMCALKPLTSSPVKLENMCTGPAQGCQGRSCVVVIEASLKSLDTSCIGSGMGAADASASASATAKATAQAIANAVAQATNNNAKVCLYLVPVYHAETLCMVWMQCLYGHYCGLRRSVWTCPAGSYT